MLDVSNMIDERIESSIFRATVTAISANSVRIKRVGATVEDAQDYAAVDIYPFPAVDDEVLVLRLGKGYTVLGRLVRSGLDVLHTQLGDLLISGQLTLGTGGSIVDADGSSWSQSGIVLQSSALLGDSIRFTRSGFGSYATIQSAIDTDLGQLRFSAIGSGGRTSAFSFSATNVDSSTDVTFETTKGGGGLGTRMSLFANGSFILTLGDNAGAATLTVKDSDLVDVFRINSNGGLERPIANDATALGAYFGRVPFSINGVQKYLPVYN